MHADIQKKKDEMRQRYITSERHTIQVPHPHSQPNPIPPRRQSNPNILGVSFRVCAF